MAISGTSNTELTDTFDTFRFNVNTIAVSAADTNTTNQFLGTQNFDTIEFSDGTQIRSLADAIPFAIALG
jgi:hypothetical protein